MNNQHETGQQTTSLIHFSPKLLALDFSSILIVGILLVVFWPKRALFDYIAMQRIPVLFPAMFIATLIIISYTDLRHGCGELIEEPKYPYLLGRRVIPFEITYTFFPNGLIQFAIYSLFSLVLLLPMLITSAAVSKISGLACIKALSILYTASLLCRILGLLAFLLFGPQHILGYFLSRIFFMVFMFVTGFSARSINPIYLILVLYKEKHLTLWSSLDIYTVYMITTIFCILLLTLINHMMVQYLQQKQKKTWTQKPVL